jgi:hypothetical protein
VAGYFEHDNEPSGSMKCEEFLNMLGEIFIFFK